MFTSTGVHSYDEITVMTDERKTDERAGGVFNEKQMLEVPAVSRVQTTSVESLVVSTYL